MSHRMKIFYALFYDPAGRPGLGFFGLGTLLNVINKITHQDALFYASMYSLIAGGTYYLLKIIFEFVKKSKS